MTDDARPQEPLTPEILLRGYAMGIFPMAEHRHDTEIFWVDPRRRGVFPLDGFHISRTLARRMQRGGYTIAADTAFSEVLDACADRAETWISAPIRALYCALHADGHAHSLELWQNGQLRGGVYGVTLGSAFFGESMFSRQTDASKIVLAHLVDHLRTCGFTLFDTQFLTDHLQSLGAVEISRTAYHELLEQALQRQADFHCLPPSQDASGVIQRITQTS